MTHPSRSILIIGLGGTSIAIAHSARELGLEVIGWDRDPQASGSPYVDQQIVQSTDVTLSDADLAGISAQGVICSSSSVDAFELACAISTRLNITGPDADWGALRDKWLLAEALADLGPQTSLNAGWRGSCSIICKPRFAFGPAASGSVNESSVYREKVSGQEFFVGGLSTGYESAPKVI